MTIKAAPEPALSVIVPVYNVEDYIEQCLTSLITQIARDVEIIVVDDCGTDDSMRKAQRIATSDSRIRIIRNPRNMGTGAARNAGIKVAQGRYLGFVDADDWVSAEYFSELLDEASSSSCDIVSGRVVAAITDSAGTIIHTEPINDPCELAHELEAKTPFIDCAYVDHCGSIYARELVAEHNACYGDGRNAEDTQFVLMTRHYARSYRVCEKAQGFYCYMMREASATHRVSSQRFAEELASAKWQIDFMCAHTMKQGVGYRRAAEIITSLLLLAANMPDTQSSKHAIRALIDRVPNKWRLAKQGKRIFAFVYGNILLP